MDTAALIASVVVSVATATWVIRSKLSDIELKLGGWVAKTEALEGRVIRLETGRKRR